MISHFITGVWLSRPLISVLLPSCLGCSSQPLVLDFFQSAFSSSSQVWPRLSLNFSHLLVLGLFACMMCGVLNHFWLKLNIVSWNPFSFPAHLILNTLPIYYLFIFVPFAQKNMLKCTNIADAVNLATEIRRTDTQVTTHWVHFHAKNNSIARNNPVIAMILFSAFTCTSKILFSHATNKMDYWGKRIGVLERFFIIR